MSCSFWWSFLQEVVCVKTTEPQTLPVVTKTVISDVFLSVPAPCGFPPTVTVSFLERSLLQNRNGVNLLFFTGQNSCGFFSVSEKRKSELAPDTGGGATHTHTYAQTDTHRHTHTQSLKPPSNTPLKLWGLANVASIHNNVPTLLVGQVFCD